MTDFGHHLIAPTEQPVKHLRRAKAAIQPEHNPLPPLPRPAQAGFQLPQSRFQRRDCRRFAPQQRLMEHFPIVTGGAPQRFASRLATVAPHPGPLAPLGLGANGQRGDIHIDPQQALGESMVGCGSIALQVIPRHPLKLVDCLRGTGLQGARNGRLLGTARPPKGALYGGIGTNRDITLGDGLGATEDPNQAIEDLVDRTIADRFLGNLDLLAQRGKETSTPLDTRPGHTGWHGPCGGW